MLRIKLSRVKSRVCMQRVLSTKLIKHRRISEELKFAAQKFNAYAICTHYVR